MANVFYDRSGKAHVIGEKDNSKTKPTTKSKNRPSPKPIAKAGPNPSSKSSTKPSRPGPFDIKSTKRSTKGKPSNRPSREKGSFVTRAKSQPRTLRAVVDKNKRGSAFLVFDRFKAEDIFIPRHFLDQLFHGDRVEVTIDSSGELQDIAVIAHRFREIFGRLERRTRGGVLIYERKKTKEEVWIPEVPPAAKHGDWIRAELTFGESRSAKVVEVIGPDLPARFDIAMVSGEFNLKEHHSANATKEAESFSLDVDAELKNRVDLRHLPLMTIDGERARDFDDAVFVEKKGKGFRLWVAIADVSNYVREGTALDSEAFERGTSVYFPERAFHMLPRALSEELCSLKPKVPRLAMACSIEYSETGEKGKIEVMNAIIESRRRATYTEIQEEIENSCHTEMFALYQILRAQRNERGSIDFEFPEAEIILDEQTGEPSDIVVRPRKDAHRLIEEFMIAANESVTEWMLSKKLPFIYRVHDEPSPEAIEKFKKLARMMGVALADRGGSPEPKVLAEFIRKLSGHPAEPVLAIALLRSMKQAIYSGSYGQHYGLASEGYTHFTSPIRRYPDLVVHRLLKRALAKEKPAKEEDLEKIAEHCSYRERIASEAERESIRFKQVRLMAKHLGGEFEGKISGLSERGMFIQLDRPHCEGMVSTDSMKDDWYEYNEDRMVLSGRKKKRTFTIGMRVKIQVARVDLDSRQVEFQLIESKV